MVLTHAENPRHVNVPALLLFSPLDASSPCDIVFFYRPLVRGTRNILFELNDGIIQVR